MSAKRVLLFYKPYGVVSQFTALGDHSTLSEFGFPPGVYPAGRLDHDSEGLLVLTDDGELQRKITDPRWGHSRTYWTQVEREPTAESLAALAGGVPLRDGRTRPCRARLIKPRPEPAPRDPPIRVRKKIPTAWIELVLTEGRNRQVRRMTAAIGHPTLRLLRVRVGDIGLDGLSPGQWRSASVSEIRRL